MDFDSAFKSYLKNCFLKADWPAQKSLRKSLFYSLFGKSSRFRPKLCFASAKALGKKPKDILPWAMAMEMLHTASLIHDDLPCMDNAFKRRGKKCNHLVFGEDIALLAGTCLFVESFSLLTKPLFGNKRPELLNFLISKIGFKGLMSGQALDLKGTRSKSQFFKMIELKTASLIEASVQGPLLLWGKTKEQKKALKGYSKNLGLAYQLADDIKDEDAVVLSKKSALLELKKLREKSLKALEPLGNKAKDLKSLIFF